jgi:tetratricopeptide (TPR) repeat protein
MNEQSHLSTIAAFLGEAAYRLGRLDDALRYSEESEALGASDDFVTQVVWRVARAKVLATRGHAAEAEGLARDAVGIASETDFLDMRADAHMALAEVLRAAGRPEEAGRQVEEALALYERKGNLVGAARARASL